MTQYRATDLINILEWGRRVLPPRMERLTAKMETKAGPFLSVRNAWELRAGSRVYDLPGPTRERSVILLSLLAHVAGLAALILLKPNLFPPADNVQSIEISIVGGSPASPPEAGSITSAPSATIPRKSNFVSPEASSSVSSRPDPTFPITPPGVMDAKRHDSAPPNWGPTFDIRKIPAHFGLSGIGETLGCPHGKMQDHDAPSRGQVGCAPVTADPDGFSSRWTYSPPVRYDPEPDKQEKTDGHTRLLSDMKRDPTPLRDLMLQGSRFMIPLIKVN
jgi:hypothetical protein